MSTKKQIEQVTVDMLIKAYQHLKFAIVKADKQEVFNQLEGATISDSLLVIEEYLSELSKKGNSKKDE